MLPASSGDYKVVQRIADRVIKAVELGRGGGFQSHVSKCALPASEQPQGVVLPQARARDRPECCTVDLLFSATAVHSAVPSLSCAQARECMPLHGQYNEGVLCVLLQGTAVLSGRSAWPASVHAVMQTSESVCRFDWEVVVVEDKTPNAFVLPGGKIVVFTGTHLDSLHCHVHMAHLCARCVHLCL